MVSENPESKKRRLRSRRWWKLAGVFMFLAFFFLASSPYLDTLAVKPMRCEVVSAEPRTATGGGRGSVSTSEVLVETTDCGPIVSDQGVDYENQEEVAASFKPGSEYEFDLGWYSRFRKNFDDLPSAQDYRLVQ